MRKALVHAPLLLIAALIPHTAHQQATPKALLILLLFHKLLFLDLVYKLGRVVGADLQHGEGWSTAAGGQEGRGYEMKNIAIARCTTLKFIVRSQAAFEHQIRRPAFQRAFRNNFSNLMLEHVQPQNSNTPTVAMRASIGCTLTVQRTHPKACPQLQAAFHKTKCGQKLKHNY